MNESEYRVGLQSRLQRCNVPDGLHDGLINYLASGTPCGHFLTAVLSNDLKGACNRADLENKYRIWDIVFFLFNYAPGNAWGSVERVQEWRDVESRATDRRFHFG